MDEKRNNQSSHPGNAQFALDQILEKYNSIPQDDIQRFCPVYYPIAIVEMEMDEMSFEDFESVQLSLLKMMQYGISDYKVLAATMGLSPNYVFKMMRLLSGYGHVDENGITDLGRASVEKGQKLTKTRVRQKFQIDAMTGTLLRVEQTITENALKDKTETSIFVAHLDSADGITFEAIRSQIMNRGDGFLQKKEGILNTNVTAIHDIQLVEMKYARSYLMKLKKCDTPIIFAKRMNSNAKSMKQRFDWMPYFALEPAARSVYGIDASAVTVSDAIKKYLLGLEPMLAQHAETMNAKGAKEKFLTALRSVYPFTDSGLVLSPPDRSGKATAEISAKCFGSFRKSMVNILIAIGTSGRYLAADDKLQGQLISIVTKDAAVLKVSKLLVSVIPEGKKHIITNELKEHFGSYEGAALIEDMIEFLSKKVSEADGGEAK